MISTLTGSIAASSALNRAFTPTMIPARSLTSTHLRLQRTCRPGSYPQAGTPTGAGHRRRPGGPLVLAHRGSSAADRPENTVAAAVAALAGGADGVEVDIRASADGVLLCCHDPDLSRLAGTPLSVAAHPAAALRRVRLRGGHALATLEELLSAVARRGRRRVVVEAKECVDLSSARRLAATLREVLGDFAAALDLTVSSFDPVLLGAVRASLADLEVGTALLGSSFAGAANLLRDAVAEGHDEIHPYLFSLLRAPNVADAARTLGIGVTCWTVNRPRHVERLAAVGVDGLITDDAAGVRATLRSRPGSTDREDCLPGWGGR